MFVLVTLLARFWDITTYLPDIYRISYHFTTWLVLFIGLLLLLSFPTCVRIYFHFHAVQGRYLKIHPRIARFIGPTWGPPGDDRTQVGPVLAPWTLLSGSFSLYNLSFDVVGQFGAIVLHEDASNSSSSRYRQRVNAHNASVPMLQCLRAQRRQPALDIRAPRVYWVSPGLAC